MSTKFLVLMFAIGLTIGIARVQSQLLTGTPVESPAPSKHRTQKTTEAIPPVESAASPSAAKSPAALPTPKRIRRKAAAEVSASPSPRRLANSNSSSHVCSNRSSLPLHRREFSAGKWKRRCGSANAALWRPYAHSGPCSVSSTEAVSQAVGTTACILNGADFMQLGSS